MTNVANWKQCSIFFLSDLLLQIKREIFQLIQELGKLRVDNISLKVLLGNESIKSV